ncbi:MAG: hypothetical protein DRQ55_13485 [Planctomycetota bacterium]|nr:MAG: hypothetical protein DRQ55_13485 [Planctomycetota bacterium]
MFCSAPLPLIALALCTGMLRGQGGPPPPPQPLQPPAVPAANPSTPARVALGQTLFWDEQLSSTRSTACGTCHIPGAGSSDPRTLIGAAASTHPGADGVLGTPDDVAGSPGVPLSLADGAYIPAEDFGLEPQVTGRKAPPAINAAYMPTLFWDGRAGGAFNDPDSGELLIPNGGALENQALGPLLSTAEMGHLGRNLTDVALRVEQSEPLALSPALPAALAAWIGERSYAALFQEAFGSEGVTPARMGLAIAAYERTLFSDQTPWDAFAASGPGALTPLENQGRQVFVQAGCRVCHSGALFSDTQFHYIGVRPPPEDFGRFETTGVPGDRGSMKTPSLRNVQLRAPFMHGGQLATLAQVVDFYDRGGDFNAPNKAPQIQPLGLSPGEKNALVAFLGRPLTDPRVLAESGPFERPLLASEAGRLPSLFGAPSPGSAGLPPQAVAVEPPHQDNPNLTLALQRGLGGAPVWLGLDLAPGSGAPLHGAASWLAFSPAVQLLPLGALSGSGPGAGWLSAVADLSVIGPSLVGVNVYAQWFVIDPGASGGLAASAGVELSVF